MSPRGQPAQRRDGVRLLVFDVATGARVEAGAHELARQAIPGSLWVVNDAATLPASLAGCTDDGTPIELRLLGAPEQGRVRAVLFGSGDYHTPTELRAPPPALEVGGRLRAGAVRATVAAVSPRSPRLLTLALEQRGDALWAALYASGRPVQYAHHSEDLPLAAFQTAYAGRPFAAEMPSAGRPLSAATLLSLRRVGVELASLTHAAGLSATGDPALDAALPLSERYTIPASTARAVQAAVDARRPVIAVGTSVVRALEGSALANGGRVVAGEARTSLVIDRTHRLQLVSGLVSGLHAPEESHHRLLEAFMSPARLEELDQLVRSGNYHDHELGDVCLMHGAGPSRERGHQRSVAA